MDLYYYQLKIVFLFILLFFGCESIIENNINETTSEFEVISFYVDYDNQENEISVYLEVSESDEISSVSAEIFNPDNNETIMDFYLDPLGDLNPKALIVKQGSNSPVIEVAKKREIGIFNLLTDNIFNFKLNY